MIPVEAAEAGRRYLTLNFWLNRDCPMSHGYTRANEDYIARFRVGPVVVGWEIVLHKEEA